MHIRKPKATHHQRGAALVIGLIVLLMLTLLGVSNMNMTSLELKITSNTQNRNHAFQGAASTIEQVIQAPVGSAFRINYTSTEDQAFDLGTLNDVSSTATASFVGNLSGINCPLSSLNMSCNFYKIRTSATHGPSGAVSVQEQGFYRPGIQVQ